MARPRMFTDKELRSKAKTAGSVPSMAKEFGVSPVAVYRHMQRLGIKPPQTGVKRGPRQKRTLAEIKSEASKASSYSELASRLKISIPTARKYAEFAGIRVGSISNEELLPSYRLQETLQTISERSGRSRNTAKRLLLNEAAAITDGPVPRDLDSIKVYNWFKENPDNPFEPAVVSKLLNVSVETIELYSERRIAFNA